MKQKYSVNVEGLGITISTGSIAKQANGAVTIQLGETSVFVSAVAAAAVKPDQDFFPLTVDYREKFSAAGRVPGGYIKREGRPSEKEILISRLCDRPLRPLFPKGFINEVQVMGMLLSADLTNEPDVLFVNGASAAMMCSDIPWDGPIGCVRVAEIDGKFIVNPTNEEIFESRLDLVYVGNEKDMMMIEGSADQLPEERFIEALEFAHSHIQAIIKAQKVLATVEKLVGERLSKAVFQDNKAARRDAVAALKEEAAAAVETQMGEEFDPNQIRLAFGELEECLYRNSILDEGKRVDGRGVKDLRSLSCEAGVLPRVHGSAIFERGETQALVTATLGNSKDVQELDALTGGANAKSFVLHYNFPPFSTGETGRIGATGRREVGHGALAERSLLPIVPPEDEFPYSIRIVSDILESNGSSSMASVCGGCLALMDAGVPILDAVAGISAGLVTKCDDNGNITKHVVLTDILGAEDHYGDMDFKIAGTRTGITGFQLDLKIKGLPIEIAKEAILRNKDMRMQILDVMAKELPEPRKELRQHAPRIHQMKIDPDKIGALIGPGGKNIKRITEVTGAQIDINEDNSGNLLVFATSKESLDRAVAEVSLVVSEIEVGKTYRGMVKSTKEFGAFVECIIGKEGLVHISELAEGRVNQTEDVCKVGDILDVKCIGVDEKGRVRLSRKAVLCEQQGIPYEVQERQEKHSRAPRGHHGYHERDRGGDNRKRSRDRY